MDKPRKRAAPATNVPVPYNPMTGKYSPLSRLAEKMHVAVLKVTAIHDDYLTCKGFLPDTCKFFKSVNVAKPHALQKTPWDGATVTFPDYDREYAYTDDNTRTVTIDPGGANEREVVETVNQPYFVDDLLICAKPMTHIGETPGVPVETESKPGDYLDIMWDEDGKPISWIDLNVAGRAWSNGGNEVRIIKGSLYGALTSATDGELDGIVTLAGPVVPVTDEPLSVINVFSWDADDNAVAMAIWNPDAAQWELFQVECPA